MDDLEIIETDETNHDALAAYYAEGSNRDHDKPPVSPYNPLLHILSVCDRLSFIFALTEVCLCFHNMCSRMFVHVQQVLNPYLGLAVEKLEGMFHLNQSRKRNIHENVATSMNKQTFAEDTDGMTRLLICLW